MRKFFFLIMLVGSCQQIHASGIYNPGSTSGSGSGIVSPGTFTWTNANGITVPNNTSVSTGVINLTQLANVASANGIINGNFQFWQRNSTFSWTGLAGYTADRWQQTSINSTPNGSFIRVSTVTHSAQYAMQMNITLNTGTPDQEYLRQQIENYYEYAGSSVTLTAWVNSNTTTSIAIKDSLGVSTSSTHTGNSTWQQLSVTRYVSTNTTSLEVQLGNQSNPSVSVQYFDGVMMVPGDAPINYVPRSWADELALCQRYYEKSYAVDTAPATATSTNAEFQGSVATAVNAQTTSNIPFKVQKRTTNPSITLYNRTTSSTGSCTWRNSTGTSTDRTTAVDASSSNGFDVNQGVNNTDIFLNGCHWVADSEM